MKPNRALIVGLAACAVLVAACGGSSTTKSSSTAAGGASSTLAPTTVATTAAAEPATTAPAPATTAPAATVTWEQVKPGGDCMCSDKSEFSYLIREADPNKVLFFLEGGGACFDVKGCGPTSQAFTRTANASAEGLSSGKGIFDLANPKNPFANYSMVFVPYCTGDVHLGNITKDYGEGVVIEHKGFVNASAALDGLAKRFPNAGEIVVAGASAGSVPSPLFGGLARDRNATARITVLADGSGGYPDLPVLNTAIITNTWGGDKNVPKWPTNADVTPENWSFPGLFVRAGAHAPDIVFARHDFAFDNTQVFFAGLAGLDAADLVKLIDKNEADVEAKGQKLFSYISPGSEHTIVGKPDFYTQTVNGVVFVEWVRSLVEGKPIEDVHCTACA
jgi:hypothetical protein